METRAHHVLIGLFTLTVFAGAMLSVLWMAKSGTSEETDAYDVIFREAVTGLSIGSRVLYSGIHVGTVQRLEIDPADPRQVVARIQVAATTPIKRDTRAELVLANITGAAEIQLSGGSPESPPLEAEANGVPTIIADPSGIARLRGTGAELFDKLSDLIDRGNRLLSDENTAHLGRTLEHLSRFSGSLVGQGDEIRRSLQGLAQASQRAEQLLQRVDGLVAGQGEALMNDGAKAMASLERATASLERLLRENEDALGNGLQGLTSIGPALDELRRTLAILGGAVRRIDEDPRAYLLGRESVREFQP